MYKSGGIDASPREMRNDASECNRTGGRVAPRATTLTERATIDDPEGEENRDS